MIPRRDLLVAGAVLLAGTAQRWFAPDLALDLVPGRSATAGAGNAVLLVAATGLLLRRTRPVTGAVLGAVALGTAELLAGDTGLVVAGAVFDLLFCAVLYTAERTSRAVSAVAGATIVLWCLGLVFSAGRTGLYSAVNIVLVLGVPLAWSNEVRHHRERAEQTRRLAALKSAAAVAAERARMARDLHDVIAGQLSGIAIQSAAALSLPDADRGTLERVLGSVRRDSVAALAEMRAMIGLLRSDDGSEERSPPAGLDRLDTLLASARAAGQRVELDDRRDGPLPAAVDLAAFRVVQESLTNALKHAPGETVRLGLARDGDDLVVCVDNDLSGRPPGAGTGTGLLGLGERARAVGGRFSAGPHGRTWSVRAVLPVGRS